jgi:hypothetical protein
MASQPQPQPQGRSQQQYAQQQPQAVQTAAPVAQAVGSKSKRRGWLVLLQFVIGLLIIVGVAAAIVMLYMKYYQ